MQLLKATIIGIVSLTATVHAASLAFQNKDIYDLIMCFMPGDGQPHIPGLRVPAGQRLVIGMPHNWHGNTFTIFPGENAVDKFYGGTIIGEVSFNNWRDGDGRDQTGYDISAEDKCCYNDGIHRTYPADVNGYNSGCYRFPCGDVYNHWPDVRTRMTFSDNIVFEIGLENRGRSLEVEEIDPALLVDRYHGNYPALEWDPVMAARYNYTRTPTR